MAFTICLFALFGTIVQAWYALRDLAKRDRDTLDHLDVEDQLVAEHPRGRRRRARRQVLALRFPEERRQIRRLQLELASWVTLSVAAAMSLVGAL